MAKNHDKPVLLHHLNDYAPSGLEFAEIKTRLIEHLHNPQAVIIQETAIPALDTMALAFVTGQLAFAPYSGRMVIYGNCAPRRQSTQAQKNNIDHGIKYARLKNGVEIINVYSEYAFGFVKSQLEVFYELNVPNQGSQFRSRDFFPRAVAKIVNGDYEDLAKKLDITQIADIPHNLIAWTDGFGNLKTTMRLSDIKQMGLKPGDKVQVILNGVSLLGVVSLGGFQVERGVLAINAGSSGYDDPFIELFLRVHHMSEKTAAVRFDYPEGGTKFELKRIDV